MHLHLANRSASSVCIPKEVFSEVGLFKVGAWKGEDVDLWGRIALRYSCVFSWTTGAIYHLEATHRACLRGEPIYSHPFEITAKEITKEVQASHNQTNDFKEFIARRQLEIAAHNIIVGHTDVARTILKRCETVTSQFFCNLPEPCLLA